MAQQFSRTEDWAAELIPSQDPLADEIVTFLGTEHFRYVEATLGRD